VALIGTLVSLSVIFLILSAQFVAAIQVIVYAGAILVLFLFVLMLLNIGHVAGESSRRPIQTLLGGLGVVAFAFLLLATLRGSGTRIPGTSGEDPAAFADPSILARLLYSGYLLHFEAVSVLLLAALVGAFVLARREKRP
jgi:NADH-quinone oxidoreductase subunit J